MEISYMSACLIGIILQIHSVLPSSVTHRTEDTIEAPATTVPPNVFYLLEHCHMTVFSYFYDDNENDYIPVKSSIRLHLDNDEVLGANLQFKCYATIVSAVPGHRLMLHFNKVNINSKFMLYLHERLHIFDGASKKPLTPNLGLFGNYSNEPGSSQSELKDFISIGPSLFLYYEGIPTYSSMDAVVTAFQDTVNGTCSKGYFLCRISEICIPEALQCDGLLNCGGQDQSDEEQCYRMSDDVGYGQQQFKLETTKLISGGDSPVRGDGGGRGCEVRADSTYTISEHKICKNCWHSKDAENIGVMVGSTVSLLILMIVIIWFSIICIKRALLKRDLRRLLRSMAGQSPVSPDQDRLYMPPHAAMAMLSPPPVYTEHNPHPPSPTSPSPSGTHRPPRRQSPISIELPPPYWAEAYNNNNNTTAGYGLLQQQHNHHHQQQHHHNNNSSDTEHLIPNATVIANCSGETTCVVDGRVGGGVMADSRGGHHHRDNNLAAVHQSLGSHAATLIFSPASELPKYSSRDDLPSYDVATGEAEPAEIQRSNGGQRSAADVTDGGGGGTALDQDTMLHSTSNYELKDEHNETEENSVNLSNLTSV